MTVVRWKIWYAEGVYDSAAGSWAAAPAGGVQAVVYWTKHGPTLSYGADEYTIPDETAVKYGSEIGWVDYQRIIRGMIYEVAPHLPDPFGGER